MSKYLDYLIDEYGLTYSILLDTDGNPSPLPRGTRILYHGNSGTVMAQQLHYDGDETFWGNVAVLMDDGSKIHTNGWMVIKLISL